MAQKYFVAGIDTNAGKTVIAAILTEALQADYWKPIQAGDLENTDSMKVASLVSNGRTKILPETYRLTHAMSPHVAAEKDGVAIDINAFSLPAADRNLVIEGAGGLLVPINHDFLMIDLIRRLGVEVILVSKNYLGSINHTLLSILALQQYGIGVKGIIFNGIPNEGTESIILERSGYKPLGRVGEEAVIDKQTVLRYAAQFAAVLNYE